MSRLNRKAIDTHCYAVKLNEFIIVSLCLTIYCFTNSTITILPLIYIYFFILDIFCYIPDSLVTKKNKRKKIYKRVMDERIKYISIILVCLYLTI